MKPLVITKNDIAIFRVLQEFPCLSLPFIAELLGKKPHVYSYKEGKTETRYPHLRARLAQLRAGGYLDTVEAVRPRVGQKNRHHVYCLNTKSRKLLPDAPHCMRRGNNPHHDLGSSFIAASFKLGAMADTRLRYITPQEFLEFKYCPDTTRNAEYPFAIPVNYWHGKPILDAVKKHDWRPFGVEHNGRKILFAGIEYDRDTEDLRTENAERSSIERHLRMILALLDDGYADHFGTAKLFVPIIANSKRRMETIKQVLHDLTEGKGAERILFGYMPDWDVVEAFPKADGHMLTQVWERVGYPPFDILETLGAKEKGMAA